MPTVQVTLYCDCPFWPDDGMCAMRDCSVCECPPDEVPQLWKDAEAGAAGDGTCLSRKKTGMLKGFPHANATETPCSIQVVYLPSLDPSHIFPGCVQFECCAQAVVVYAPQSRRQQQRRCSELTRALGRGC